MSSEEAELMKVKDDDDLEKIVMKRRDDDELKKGLMK